MANKVQKPCRICGKMFTPCADCENDKTMFRWKKVACSPKCAKEYFAKIEESRHKTKTMTLQPVDTEKVGDIATEVKVITENVKPKRTKKKNIENNESEQID